MTQRKLSSPIYAHNAPAKPMTTRQALLVALDSLAGRDTPRTSAANINAAREHIEMMLAQRGVPDGEREYGLPEFCDIAIFG